MTAKCEHYVRVHLVKLIGDLLQTADNSIQNVFVFT
jgi:hypothetical protein